MVQQFAVLQNQGSGNVTPLLVHLDCSERYQKLYNQGSGPYVIIARGTIVDEEEPLAGGPLSCRWCYGDLTDVPQLEGGMNKYGG